jgi:hypothetical protein
MVECRVFIANAVAYDDITVYNGVGKRNVAGVDYYIAFYGSDTPPAVVWHWE